MLVKTKIAFKKPAFNAPQVQTPAKADKIEEEEIIPVVRSKYVNLEVHF